MGLTGRSALPWFRRTARRPWHYFLKIIFVERRKFEFQNSLKGSKTLQNHGLFLEDSRVLKIVAVVAADGRWIGFSKRAEEDGAD
jgi:hypothetical protein